MSADATATNTFLVGGLEPAEQRAAYEADILAASTEITHLAGSNADDADLLGKVSAGIAVYAGLIEQARANNRQGFPVGAGYLDAASTELRDQVLPQLDTLSSRNTDRADSSFRATTLALLYLLLVALALVAVVWIQVWLARRTKRRLNRGLVAATAALGLGALIMVGVGVGSATTAINVKNDSYRDAVDSSRASSLAHDAKSMESFTLIKRGSGDAYQQEYTTNVQRAQGLLSGPPLAHLQAWMVQHDQIRALDDSGDWDGAVALATQTGPDSPNATFATFATSVQQQTESSAAAMHDSLSSAQTLSGLAGWLAFLAGLAAAALAWRGIAVRRQEYK